MSQNNYKDVCTLYTKFGFPIPKQPIQLPEDVYKYRKEFLQEELNEFIEAYENNNIPDQIDALVDLAYVVFGTAAFMGLKWDSHWNEVHFANMQKTRVVDTSKSKRGHSLDLIKPRGWIPPNHQRILDNEY